MAPPSRHPPPPDDDGPTDAERDDAWEAEIERRIAEVREGRVRLIPREEVTAAIREKHGWA